MRPRPSVRNVRRSHSASVELLEYVVITEESRHTHHLARRPDRPVVVPTMRADKTGTVIQVGTTTVSVNVGRAAKHAGLSLTRSFHGKYRNPPTVTTPPAITKNPLRNRRAATES